MHLEGFHRPCAEGAARDKMDAPAVGTTGAYGAFFSTAVGATAGIRTFTGRRQTVPGVCFTVTAGSRSGSAVQAWR